MFVWEREFNLSSIATRAAAVGCVGPANIDPTFEASVYTPFPDSAKLAWPPYFGGCGAAWFFSVWFPTILPLLRFCHQSSWAWCARHIGAPFHLRSDQHSPQLLQEKTAFVFFPFVPGGVHSHPQHKCIICRDNRGCCRRGSVATDRTFSYNCMCPQPAKEIPKKKWIYCIHIFFLITPKYIIHSLYRYMQEIMNNKNTKYIS